MNLESYLPDYTKKLTIDSLENQVKIYRDNWGIPHIEASTQYDLFFAQGFATAQDRLFQMDLDRLRCLGRSSEYLGLKGISNDKLNLKRNFELVAKADLKKASSIAKEMLQAFTMGVNFYINTLDNLPFEYHLLDTKPEPWKPWHSILVYKIRNAAEGSFNGKLFYSQLAKEIGAEKAAKLIPGYFPGALLTLPPGGKYTGEIENAIKELSEAARNFKAIGAIDGESNGWSISGNKTYSDFPLVAGDSHRTLDTPNVYYQVHLKCDDFEGIGYTIPGYPGFMHFAHNKNVAWGMTHGGADTQDLFLEKLRSKNNKTQFFYDDKWIDAKTYKRKINPRNSESINIEIIETYNGNILFGGPDKEYGISLSDPGGKNNGTYWIDSAYEAMISKSADDLEKAFDKWTDRTNNYPYADSDKNFGYKFAGAVPVRNRQHHWGIAKGWDPKNIVNKEVPRQDLPMSRNPKTGLVVTCNQKVVDADYPYFMSIAFAPEYRARVLVEYINNCSKKMDISNMLEMHNQIISIPAKKMINFSKKISINNKGFSELEKISFNSLIQWDFNMDKESYEACIYTVTKEMLIEKIISINYGSLSEEVINWRNEGGISHVRRFLVPLINESIGDKDSFLINGLSWEELFLDSFRKAIEFLKDKFGDSIFDWKWGALHTTNHTHPLSSEFHEYSEILNPKKVPASGDGDTPLAGSYDRNFKVSAASVNRYAHDINNWENSKWIVPLGSSGNPGSKHYFDQLELWANGETIPQLWNWKEIKNNSETLQILTSKKLSKFQ
ncbi:MAG: hypothetical protein CL740_04350 [Chloroflexi bacterium]|nr:hypothetical protein [Chloroflexota bacterium]|tara:strand:- start:31017 stop:33359 length:2343 start_codon:yes stop_codon:yes gene_type:complete